MPSDEHFTDYAYKKQLKHVVLNTEEFFVQGWGGGGRGKGGTEPLESFITMTTGMFLPFMY